MSKDKNSEQIDDDILQCKADILRASDIIPGTSAPYKKKTTSGKDIPVSSEKKKTAREDTGSIPIETILPEKPAPLPIEKLNRTEKAKQERAEIPKFDLAEEIMAEQRKITAIKRKAPGQKVETHCQRPKVEAVSRAIERQIPESSEQDRIITEIVARDIERLCRGSR